MNWPIVPSSVVFPSRGAVSSNAFISPAALEEQSRIEAAWLCTLLRQATLPASERSTETSIRSSTQLQLNRTNSHEQPPPNLQVRNADNLIIKEKGMAAIRNIGTEDLSREGQQRNDAKGASILVPEESDILFGRGGLTNLHPGNIVYRNMIDQYRDLYKDVPKYTKKLVSKTIVSAILQEGRRFLERSGDDGLWYNVSFERAVNKTSQALRDKPRKRLSPVHNGRLGAPWAMRTNTHESPTSNQFNSKLSTQP